MLHNNMCRGKAGCSPGLFLFCARFHVVHAFPREGGVVMESRQQIEKLAKRRSCPRCSLEKTEGTALCRRCRYKLPSHMRLPLEGIARQQEWVVYGALRAAANYFEIHYRSIRDFGGGRIREDD
jgi:hypothetical protein